MRNDATIIFDGKEYHVSVRQTGADTLEVTVNGQAHQVSIRDTQTASTGAAASASPAAVAQTAEIQSNQVSAPMPGDIVSIAVKPGDRVDLGQELLVLEAMKMKNVIHSPQAGKIASVEVSVGQSVQYGQPLVQFEQQ